MQTPNNSTDHIQPTRYVGGLDVVPPDYTNHNAISARWESIEQKLHNLVVEPDPSICLLETTRVRGRIRLCYCRKPMSECSAEERLRAVDHLEAFIRLWNEAKANAEATAKEKLSQLEKISEKLK